MHWRRNIDFGNTAMGLSLAEMGGAPKGESDAFLAIGMSLAAHCAIATLLLTCCQERRRPPLIPEIISVEIHTLQQPEKKAPAAAGAPPLPHRRPVPARPAVAERLVRKTEEKPAPYPGPLQTSVRAETGGTESVAITAPVQSGKGATVQENAPPAKVRDPSPRAESSVATSGGGAEVVEIRPDSAYLATLRGAIEKYKEYPAVARRGRMEGTVLIACLLTRNGRIREVWITRSSGHEILDRAALRAVRSAGEFPPVPQQIKGDSFKFLAPITYRLNNF